MPRRNRNQILFDILELVRIRILSNAFQSSHHLMLAVRHEYHSSGSSSKRSKFGIFSELTSNHAIEYFLKMIGESTLVLSPNVFIGG